MKPKPRTNARSRLMPTFQLAIILPAAAAALAILSAYYLQKIQRDRAVEGAFERDFNEMLAISEKQINHKAYALADDVRDEVPSTGDACPETMDRILLSHPYVAHLLLYDPEHGVIMRSQPDRLKNDPGFRDEADHWSRFAEGWWRLEYDDLTKKLAKMPNTGTPYLFEDQWMPRGDRHVYSDMAMFLKTDEETGTRSIAGIVFDPGYLRDRFFPQVLNEVMSRSVAEEQTDKDAVVMQHGFTLEEKIGEVPPLEVDREAMARNLVNNALKYSQDRKYIGVNLYRDNGCVTLEVVDHGIGIPASELHKIFQKFYRVGDPLVHNTKGSGLGLSLVQHIARAHGGDVMVDSTPGAGSKFTISLPLDRDGQSTKAASA